MAELTRLKTINPFFQEVWIGNKTFEIRKADRDFQVGQLLELFEYDPAYPNHTTNTRAVLVEITYMLTSEQLAQYGIRALANDYVCFSFKAVRKYVAAFGPDAPAFP